MAMIGIKINKTTLDWKNFTKKKKKVRSGLGGNISFYLESKESRKAMYKVTYVETFFVYKMVKKPIFYQISCKYIFTYLWISTYL